MSRWFRLYDELLDDPKVQLLPDEDFKGYINLLCLASRNGGRLPEIAAISYALRRSSNGVETLIKRLQNGGLIDSRNGGKNGAHYAIHGWDKRQFKSDISTERVKRFRERQGTLFETPSESETESETESARAREIPDREKKATQPSPQYEIEGEETIMATVRRELDGCLNGAYALGFCHPDRPISFVREEGRLIAYGPSGFAVSMIRDHEYQLAAIAKRHGFTDAWIKEKPP